MNSIKKQPLEIKAYHDLYRAFKKLHTFRIQKAVRMLKKKESYLAELKEKDEAEHKIESANTEISRCLK